MFVCFISNFKVFDISGSSLTSKLIVFVYMKHEHTISSTNKVQYPLKRKISKKMTTLEIKQRVDCKQGTVRAVRYNGEYAYI